ncbi:MAG: hypothetical protein GF329_13950 [Candidatus Lokiarchaeota archaeon]|nr:hypothetical protein [Candidatus Lokiarchaeota archaeon]
MDQEIDDVIPFLIRVLNDMYRNVKDISKSMENMNSNIEKFSQNITDHVVKLSSDLTGIIQIVKGNRKAIFKVINNEIDELSEEFNKFKVEMSETHNSSEKIYDNLGKAKIDLQNKMQDAEFLSIVLELKDLLEILDKNV